MESKRLFDAWRNEPSLSSALCDELSAISGDEQEIEERFYRDLEFGTAGLRGVIGAGTNRMNVPVVRHATQGLSDMLLSLSGAARRGVCIAYDSRRLSDVFARETACVLAANGIRVCLFSSLHSVPQLSVALQRHGCIAGVVITASHNPKQYNGYKVYWDYGGQASPEQAAEIYKRIQARDMFDVKSCAFDEAVANGRITLLGEEDDEAYLSATAELLLWKDEVKAHGGALKIVYTPLHGTGAVPVVKLLSRVGVTNVLIVPEQAEPNADFPTVSAPNPEDPNAFRLAIALAEANGARVCLATDPDADRLGIAVQTAKGDWATLTGNQIGCILLEHVLSSLQKQGRLPKNGVVIKSLVSTNLAGAICARYGVTLENVLTGFRFIGERVDAYQKSGEKTFLFGFEESFGFLAGGLSRDKDAICSAMFAAEACVMCDRDGKTLYDALQSIYKTYGFYEERVASYTAEGKAGLMRIAACMASLRETPPEKIADASVLAYEDYQSRVARFMDGRTEKIDLPETDMLRFLLDGGAWVVIRPSGTEPKLKLYVAANEKTHAGVTDTLDRLYTALDALIREKLS